MELQQLAKDTTRKTNMKSNWISVGASIRINEIPFNKQLDTLNCQTLKDLCNLLIAGKLRRITDEEQIDIMKVQTQATGLSTAQIGDKFDFWKQVDDEDFHKWLLGKYNSHTGNCYHSYYLRYVNIFFGPNPDVELLKLAKHKRSWILQSIKRFGDYYVNRYGNKEVKFLIARIIESAQSFGCQCEKLHVVNCKNGLSVIAINWTRGNKKALATIIPTSYWEKLRNMTNFDEYDIQAAHKILKREAGIAYVVLRKIHYNVMRFNNIFELDEAEVFAGRFKSVSARHYVLNDPEKLSGKYISAWQNFGINSF